MSSLWRFKADTGPHTDWCTRTQTHSHEPRQQQTQTQMDTKGGGKNTPQCLQGLDNWSYCSVVSVHPVRDTIVLIPMVMSRRMSIHIYIFKWHLCVLRVKEPKYRSISSLQSQTWCVSVWWWWWFSLYLGAWHNREEVEGGGSLRPVGVHGNGCCGVLDESWGCDGGRLWGLSVGVKAVGTVDELQMQHLRLELADGAQLRPPRHAIGSSPHMALRRLEERRPSVGGRGTDTDRESVCERARRACVWGWHEETEPANKTALSVSARYTLAANTELLIKDQEGKHWLFHAPAPSCDNVHLQCRRKTWNLPVSVQFQSSRCNVVA